MKKVPKKTDRHITEKIDGYVPVVVYKFVKNNTIINYTPKQGRFPVFVSELLEISDPVIVLDHVMEAIGVQKYLKGAVPRPI